MDKEYITFTDKLDDGSEIEMAVIEEFEFEQKYYVASALVEDDAVNENNIFIYRLRPNGKDDYSFERIADEKEFERVSKAYMYM